MKLLPLHFVGANGFVVNTYIPMLKQLATSINGVIRDSSHVPRDTAQKYKYIIHPTDYHEDLLGDNVTDWEKAIDNFASKVSQLGKGGVGVGHSGGGTLVTAASIKYPDLFKEVIVYDPAIFSKQNRLLFAIGLTLPRRVSEAVYPPLKVARERDSEWNSLDEAKLYFKKRKLFSKFDKDILEHFFIHGLTQGENGKVSLTFKVEAEYNMMRSVPTSIPLLSGKTKLYESANTVKGVYGYSAKHDFVSSRDVNDNRSLFNQMKFIGCENPHFWPLIDPNTFANFIANNLK